MGARLPVALAAAAAGIVLASPSLGNAQVPALPQIPGISVQLPAPPPLPAAPEPPQIPGLNFDPPAPIAGMGVPGGTPFTVQADSTQLTGNVKLSVVTLDTALGPRRAIRIDADRVDLDNLRVQFPAAKAGIADHWLRSGPGQITTLTGNFHIIVASMNVTPEIAGVTSPVPLTIRADMAPDQLAADLQKVGLGTPDAISERMRMLNGTMETYYISSDRLQGASGGTIMQ